MQLGLAGPAPGANRSAIGDPAHPLTQPIVTCSGTDDAASIKDLRRMAALTIDFEKAARVVRSPPSPFRPAHTTHTPCTVTWNRGIARVGHTLGNATRKNSR